MARSAPGRRPRFTRAQIADVAFGIADREGFDAVSMRRVAQELGAGTMTLYHYVRTKDELVALMDDQLMGQILLPDDELAALPWRDALSAILRRSYRMRLQHPWSLSALQNAALGPNALRHTEQTLAALADSPFDEAQKFIVLTVTDSFVDGHALRAIEVRTRMSPGGTNPGDFSPEQEVASGSYPHLRRSTVARDRWWPEEAGAWMDQLFEEGIAALLDGLLARFSATALSRNQPAPRGVDPR